MKAEDLMVGNWVYYNHNNMAKPIQMVNTDFEHLPFKWATPIPLTEENIVELLGFEKVVYQKLLNPSYEIETIVFKFSNLTCDFVNKKIYVDGVIYPLPKHVHKLQQLIKSLEE